MIWHGILSIQDDWSRACLGPGGEPSSHHVPCKHSPAPINKEQMGQDLFYIQRPSGSEGKDRRVFGHKTHSVRKQVQRQVFL